MNVHVGLHVRMCRAICTYVCDGVKIRVEKVLCQGPEKGGVKPCFFVRRKENFLSEEIPIFFGQNNRFLRTKFWLCLKAQGSACRQSSGDICACLSTAIYADGDLVWDLNVVGCRVC